MRVLWWLYFFFFFSFFILEILFMLIKINSQIKWLKSFGHWYCYSWYTDHVAFFLRNMIAKMDLMMDIFSSHLDLEQSNLKCEITGNGSLKRVKMVASGAKNEDFTKYCFKTGIFFRILERYVIIWACIKQFPVFRELSISQQMRIPSVTIEDKFLTFKSLSM